GFPHFRGSPAARSFPLVPRPAAHRPRSRPSRSGSGARPGGRPCRRPAVRGSSRSSSPPPPWSPHPRRRSPCPPAL
ncbi:MAG: hypothetical protein AVDCRST_MAG13-980, partial [uncultured Solirubrobacteraceae bacterium]